MITPMTLIVFVCLVVAAAFLFMWMRRDAGNDPAPRLADALHEPLDGKSPPTN